MKQWHFEMKKYAQKHLNPWLINWTDQCIMWETSQKKLFVLSIASILTLKKLK